MTPQRLDASSVLQKLEAMAQFVDDLRGLGPVTPAELAANRATRNIAERALIGLVDLAAAINAHLSAAAGEAAPTTDRASFEALGRAGVIDQATARSLERAAGLRNVLVHLYVEVDLSVLADAVPAAIGDVGSYVEQVAGWVADRAA